MRRTVVLALLAAMLAACSSSAKSAATTTSAPTTNAPTTNAPTTNAPTTTRAASTTATLPGNVAATIQESAYVVSVDQAARTITIDPMEFLTGGPANAAFRKANPTAGADTPPNDYFIVNPTKDRVVLPLDPAFDAELVHTGDTTHTPAASVPLAQLASQPNLQYRPFWVTVERGVATRAVEQYVP